MLQTFSASLFLVLLACRTLLSAAEDAPEMTTEVCKLSFDFMGLGKAFIEPAPADPKMPADPFGGPLAPTSSTSADPFGGGGPILEVLTPPPDRRVLTLKSSRKILEEVGMTFPPGSSVIFDPVKRELTLHHTAEMQELTKAFVETLSGEGVTHTVTCTVTLVEGPAEVIRQANATASKHPNAMPQLEALLAEAARPGSGVRVVGQMSLEAKPGTRATADAVLERPQVEALQPTAPSSKSETKAEDQTPETKPALVRQDGMSLELEPRLEEDGKTLALTLALNLGPAPPKMDGDGSRTATNQPEPGLRKAGFTTATRIISGSAKLIGITQPIGVEAEGKGAGKDKLWAAFITPRVRRVRSLPGVVIATPGMEQEKLPPGMRAVTFQAPEGLLEAGIFEEGMIWEWARTARAKLESQGVTFPAGASMEQRGGLLQMVNTPENIELTAAVVGYAWGKAPHAVAFTLHTYQVPATLAQKLTATEDADDSALLAAVEAATKRGEARAVSSAFFEGLDGTRVRHESGLRHTVMTRFGAAPDSAVKSELVFEQRHAGTVLEIEPTVSADGRTMDLNYTHEIHPAPPGTQREHLHAAAASKDHDLPGAEVEVLRTFTGTAMASGTTKLVSLCLPSVGAHERAPVRVADPFGPPPGDGPLMLWATFLQAHVVPQVGKPKPLPQPQLPPLPKEQADAQPVVDKMNKIIIPVVKFEGVSTQKALECLQAKSRELDTSTEVDAEKGVNIILLEDEIPHETAIYLDLRDVPLSEALRYVTELGQCTYRVKADGVRVMHHHTVADQLHTRSYRVPRDFLSLMEAIAEPAHADPFAATPAKDASASGVKPRKTARQVLEDQGINFPEGANAFYSANTSMLLVRNTQPNLDLVEAFVDSGCHRYTIPVAITAQVLQGPGPLLRRIAAQAAPLNDHRAQMEELLAAVKAGTVQHLDTARIETTSGTRATAEQGRDLTGLSRLTLDGKGGTTMEHERLFSGLCLEAEPTVASDGHRIDLTVAAEFHTAPPVLRQEHLVDDQGRRFDFPLTDTHRAHLTTGFRIQDGHARLLHLWKPTGKAELEKADVLQVMFITCDIVWPVE